MRDAQKLKTEFDSAKSTLVQALFESNSPLEQDEIQQLLDRMTRAFNALLISTLTDYSQLPEQQRIVRTQEYTFVYAINKGDEWAGPQWYVAFVNGMPIPDSENPPLVRDFTRQMVEEGWKVISIPKSVGTDNSLTQQRQPIYELYFARDLPNGLVSSPLS